MTYLVMWYILNSKGEYLGGTEGKRVKWTHFPNRAWSSQEQAWAVVEALRKRDFSLYRVVVRRGCPLGKFL